jgi:uncharacterized delta-60 repeat protein
MLCNFLLNVLPYQKLPVSSAYLTLLILLFNIPAWSAAGDLDASFGQNGITLPPGFNGNSYATAIALQPDGKIIAGGTVPTPPGGFPGFGLARYLPNGALDTTFGTNGRVVTSLNEYTSTGTTLNAIAVLPDGKIVIAGSVRIPDPSNGFSQYALFVIRYNSDGSLDSTFFGNGKYKYEAGGINTSGEAIKVLPDGKFLVAGYTGAALKGNVPYKGLLFRFAGNGLDSTFAGGGISITPTASGEFRYFSLTTLPDNKILVGGAIGNNAIMVYFSITRYNADGTIDAGFGTNGTITKTEAFYSKAVGTLVQTDGKIIGICSVNPLSDSSDVVVFRFLPDGTPDPSFGTNGKVTTAVTNLADEARAGALQKDGKIIVAGYSYNVNTGAGYNPLVIRYNPNGTLDRTFGTGGIARQPSTAQLSDMLLQDDGKILGVGNPFNSIDFPGFRAIRYLANGARDYDFDGDRKADVSIFRPAAAEWYWLNSSNNQSSGLQFGNGTDKPVPADFDGDGKTDVSVFRDGDWYRLNSSDNQFIAVHFGQSGDIPLPSDYDGDSKADLAVYRQGTWYVLNSADNSFRAEQFGISTDKPIIGDFDGDGKADLTVYRDGVWYVQRSRDGFFGAQFGISSDKPVAADYDSDGKTDLAVYRPADGTWYLLRSHAGFTATQFGISTDKPVAADYDGDGKTDLAVYRDGDWYLLQSTAGFAAKQFGTANDSPIPNTFVP